MSKQRFGQLSLFDEPKAPDTGDTQVAEPRSCRNCAHSAILARPKLLAGIPGRPICGYCFKDEDKGFRYPLIAADSKCAQWQGR